MRFKAVLLLFLLFFASLGAFALVNLSIISNNLKTATFDSGFSSIQLTGGDPVDNPVAPCGS